jgi:glycosyltransferase involved in cell wall biosynthesis
MSSRIHVYTICWNERLMLPFFFRHYGQWAEQIVVYDNGSDDGSCEFVGAQPNGQRRSFDTGGESREDRELEVKNAAWKESRGRADWVIVCDVDELLYHPDFRGYLGECQARRVTIPAPVGYQMVSDRFPKTTGQIYDEVNQGFFDPRQSKKVLFDPDAIEETNYGPGCHGAELTGRCWYDQSPELKLLHFKFLGWEYLHQRYRELGQRKSQYDREHHFGHQYFLSDTSLEAKFQRFRLQAVPVIGSGTAAEIALGTLHEDQAP